MDLETERKSLYEAIVCMDHSRYVSERQVKALAILITKGLKNKRKANRISVMRYLIGEAVEETFGIPFTSFKNISSSIASKMIDLLLEPNSEWELSIYGEELIAKAESAVKASISSPQTANIR